MDPNLHTLTDAELLTQAGEFQAAEKAAKASFSVVRDELARRQMATGETTISANGFISTLKREPFSEAWFERITGYTKADLPPDCITEKITAAVDWDRVQTWFTERHGHPLDQTFSVAIKREKAK